MKVILVAIVVLLCAAIGCSAQPTSVPPSPMPTPTPVVCQSHDWMFEKKGSVHDDYQAICVEEGGLLRIFDIKQPIGPNIPLEPTARGYRAQASIRRRDQSPG